MSYNKLPDKTEIDKLRKALELVRAEVNVLHELIDDAGRMDYEAAWQKNCDKLQEAFDATDEANAMEYP